MGKKIVETLSIHSSRVALRARPLVKKSLLPPCFRDRPPPLHLDSIRPRAPIANKGLRRVGKASAEFRELRHPQRFPSDFRIGGAARTLLETTGATNKQGMK